MDVEGVEIPQIVAEAFLAMHRSHARDLLLAKQSDSFTTDEWRQFSDAYIAALPGKYNQTREEARRVLLKYGVVREVEPDLWGLLT